MKDLGVCVQSRSKTREIYGAERLFIRLVSAGDVVMMSKLGLDMIDTGIE